MNHLVPLSQTLPANRSAGLPQPYEPERPEVRKVVGAMLQHLKLGAIVALVLFTAVMAYALTRPPMYTSYGSVMVDPQRENLASAERPQQGGPPDVSAVETQVQLLRSRQLAEGLTRQYRLDR